MFSQASVILFRGWVGGLVSWIPPSKKGPGTRKDMGVCIVPGPFQGEYVQERDVQEHTPDMEPGG